MTFVIVEPEVSGRPASPTGSEPGYVFDTWLGDDLVRAYPALLVTSRLKRALEALPGPTGFRVSRCGVRSSSFFCRHNPGRKLPRFWCVWIEGKPGRDDFGITKSGAIVVSRRVLDVVLEHRVVQATFAKYDSDKPTRRPPRARADRA